MVDYFISLNVQSAKAVGDYAKQFFTSHGISTWMCTDIEGASTFRSDILVNIRDAKVFLILLDEKWAASNECMFEYNYAQRKNLTNGSPQIMPFVMEKFDMEKYPHVDAVMANVQGLFMSSDLKQDLITLMDMLKRYVSCNPAAVVTKATPAKNTLLLLHKASKSIGEMVNILKSLAMKEKSLPSGVWQGYFIESERNVEENKSGSKLPIDVDITFKDSNNFIGHGSDDIGKFEFQKGKIRESKVYFTKSYSTHNVCYEGQIRGVQMTGRWWLEESTDINGVWAMWPVSV